MSDLISRQAAIDATWFEPSYTDPLNVLTEVRDRLKVVPPAQPEVKEIGYAECANAMLKMWIDNVLTDGEYNRIMDRLNTHHDAERRRDGNIQVRVDTSY